MRHYPLLGLFCCLIALLLSCQAIHEATACPPKARKTRTPRASQGSKGKHAARSPKKMSSNLNGIAWGQPVEGLRPGFSAEGGNGVLHLHNAGKTPLKVFSHVESQEIHFDPFTLRLKDAQGQARTLRLTGDRERSAPIYVTLQAGSSLEHKIDVVTWAKQPINDSKPLAPGTYQIQAVYAVNGERDCWKGRLESGTLRFTVPATSGSKPLSPVQATGTPR